MRDRASVIVNYIPSIFDVTMYLLLFTFILDVVEKFVEVFDRKCRTPTILFNAH